ncbi:large ribosomal subunit protein uL30m-like [Mytilus edulis]|uniref:large ribosomal subunit protein uL30m-like n=1 Tax=Mytilus edulis TaxID=6550 RepID=UPI0039EE4A00
MSNFTKVSALLRCLPRLNKSQIRHVKIQKQSVIDEDFSWATPIVERHMGREERVKKEQEVSKLHMVQRMKDLSGRPYWEKEICEKYGLDTKLYKKVVLKNTPSVNKDLKSVAHMIKITPITFPYGLPESEEDFEHCNLQDNGEFIVKKKLESTNEGSITIDKEPKSNIWEMDFLELKKHARNKLDNWDINSEFFTPEHVYEYNQDKKEHRYFGDKAMGGKRKDWY